VQKNNATARRRLFACVGLNAKLQLCKNNKNEKMNIGLREEKMLICKSIDLLLTRRSGTLRRAGVKTWYDAVGHETSVETIGAKDISITTTHTYYTANAPGKNRAGRVWKTESKQGNLGITEEFDYDARGRLASQSSSSTGGQITTYSYGNRSQTVTTTDDNILKHLTLGEI